jgi:hypothetical protein
MKSSLVWVFEPNKMIMIFCKEQLHNFVTHNFVIHEILLGWPNQGTLEGCGISSGRYGGDEKRIQYISWKKKCNPLKHMTYFLRHNCTLGSCKCCREEGITHVSQRRADMNCLIKDITTVTTRCASRTFHWGVEEFWLEDVLKLHFILKTVLWKSYHIHNI